MTSPQHPTSPGVPRRGFPWFPFAILLLGAAGILWVRAQPELERNLKGWLTTLIPLIVLLVNLGWFFLTPRFSVRIRLLGLTALIGVAILGRMTLRIDGAMNGTGLPAFAWRWSGLPKASLPAPPMATPSAEPTPARDPRLDLARDVPQFLGARRDGTAPNPGLSTNWPTQPPRELWRRPVGLGWSAFAVVDGRAYTQEQRDTNEVVTAYDLLTGRPLWEHADTTRFVEWQGGDGPRATPTVHEGRVYAMGGTGIFNCLDAATGKPLWQHSVLVENRLGTNMWASSASPLIVDDLVIVTGGSGSGPTLLAYNRLTGVPAWTSGDDSASYASPILATLAGRRVILSNNARSLTAVDPATGKLLLEHVWGSAKFPKASQPVVLGDDRVFVSGGYGMGCQLVRVQNGTDGALKAEQVWKGVTMKTQFNSPGLREGHFYGLDDGLLACVNADTGKRVWKDGRYGSGQTLLVGNLLLVQNERGSVHLCEASPTGFREFGSINALASKTWNQPTLAGRFLLLRNDREAVCYELPGE